MAFKLFVLAALVAVARAGVVAPVAGVAYAATPVVHSVVEAEHDHNPQYTFGYNVEDPYTGDSKSQVESRSGDVVQGQYSLNDPDGTRRTVDYTADPVNGFNAVVRKDPLVAKAAVVAAPVAPVVHSAPVAYAAPASHLAYAAPVAHQHVVAAASPLAYSGVAYAHPQYYGLNYVKAAHYY